METFKIFGADLILCTLPAAISASFLLRCWGAVNVTTAFMFMGVSCFLFLSHGRDSHKIASKNKPLWNLIHTTKKPHARESCKRFYLGCTSFSRERDLSPFEAIIARRR
jgi:hypothetical protein